MNRILSLQTLEPTGFDMFGQNIDNLMDSTSSYEGCQCSTASYSGCQPVTTNLAIAQ